jgi:DNA-binding protein HU-beta
MSAITKKDLGNQVAENAELTKAEADRAVTAMTDAITAELAKGGSVALTGFGSFQVKERSARTGRNPQTGESISIAASKVPGFKAGKSLKDAVN